jgi:hypothetical protein
MGVVAFASMLIWLAATRATAQAQGPLDDLPSGVRTIAAYVDSADSAGILNSLRDDVVLRVGYPGQGVERPASEAVAELPGLLVSSPGASDELGPGRYRLLAVWLPRSQEPAVSLIGSGIGPEGTRVTTIFGLEASGDDWVIGSYGTIEGYQGMPEGIESTVAYLDFLATQGEYRGVIGPVPAPPATGTGANSASRSTHAAALLVLGAIVMASSAALFASHRSMSRRGQSD